MWRGSCFRIALVEAVGIHTHVVDNRPVVVDAVVGFAFSGSMFGSRLFDNSSLHWGLICCLFPCRVPFAENVGCLVADNLSTVNIVGPAGGFLAVPAIAVSMPLVVPAIDSGGTKVARLY